LLSQTPFFASNLIGEVFLGVTSEMVLIDFPLNSLFIITFD